MIDTILCSPYNRRRMKFKRKKHSEDTGHEGEILCDGNLLQTKCKCGYHSDKLPFPYLVISNLIQHFRKVRTLIEDQSEFLKIP